MLSSVLAFLIIFVASVAAQSSSSVVCVAGQCLQGVSNTTIGTTVSAPGAAASLLLLPGEYTSTTNPQLLHNVLTSSSASLSPSPGFANASSSSKISLPLNVALQPGVAAYPSSFYSGQGSFSQLPTSPISNTSTSLSVGSLSLSSNVWVAVNTGSNNRVIFWDSIPDFGQLPAGSATSLSLVDMQSSACSPPCAGSGVCSASGSCVCPTGFNGTSCESCAPGFFGPTCQQCPTGCTSCDDGIAGTGRCLTPTFNNLPSSCNCQNGVCGSNGQCTCLPGWTTATNGTACAQCATGFFLASNGNCQVCQLGCAQCADSSGNCIACKTGFTQDANDRTKCDAAPQTASDGTVCPDGSFSSNGACQPCSPECQTCTGGTSNDCIICGSGKVSANNTCVSTSGNGVCEGSNLIANNNNHQCDSCGPKCTTCQIPNFNVASTIDKAQCTGCISGFVLSQGKCISSCPSGTFLSPQDNLTCTACDSSCSSCAGSSTFCLTCANNQLASGGKCVSSCPSNSFSSAGICVTCHPDCATCSGSLFNQCSSCPSNLPVLTNGRCLPTCSKSQFFDKTSSTCQSCDSSCSSCTGSGPSNCLACSGSSQVLRGGTCVSATCNSGSSVVPGLGVCLSDLVVVPQPSGTSTAAPLPSITGLDSPIVASAPRRPLQWWEILLMALGCAFIFLAVLMCWRRRARKNRAKQTAAFASAKALNRKDNWLVRFGEKLFGHGPSQRVQVVDEPEEITLMKLRAAEEARHDMEMEKLIGAYEYSRAGSRAGSDRVSSRDSRAVSDSGRSHSNRLSNGSLYSEMTGVPRRTAEPRQPVKNGNVVGSRFSATTLASSMHSSRRELTRPPLPTTDAEVYAAAVRQSPEPRGTYWLTPTNTGGSNKNPFRK